MKIKGIDINYIDYGKKTGDPIIFLHGWGQNIEMMKPLADYFLKMNIELSLWIFRVWKKR